MEPARQLELLRTEGARLAAMPADHLDSPVPGLPDWTVERVLRHTGKVHRWVTAALDAAPEGPVPAVESLPRGPELIEAYAEALGSVVDALAATDPGRPAWTFRGPGDVAFWYRRQAHEVAVHRMDAADAVAAAGGPEPEPLAVDGASDGIDEWLELFLPGFWVGRREEPAADLHGSYRLVATDSQPPLDRSIRIGETITTATVAADGAARSTDVTSLRGPAADLLLVLWRRRAPDTVELNGDIARIHRLLDTVQI